MARRSAGLGSVHGKRKVGRKVSVEQLDYHEGLSPNQVKIILRERNLNIDKFNEWMSGQTCPIIERQDRNGVWRTFCGIYEYDLFRWIASQEKGTPLIWD